MFLKNQKINIGGMEYEGTVYDIQSSSTMNLENIATMHNFGKFDLLETTYVVARTFNMMTETTETSKRVWQVYQS